MPKHDELRNSCIEAISRLSNLGMAIKTAGVTLFGAGLANLLNSSTGEMPLSDKISNCSILGLLGSLFIYLDVSYLSRERAFREVQKLLLKGLWALDYLDLSIIYNSLASFPKVKKISCLRSFSVFPIILFELATIGLLFRIL